MFGKIIGSAVVGMAVARGITAGAKALKAEWVAVNGHLLSPEGEVLGTLNVKVPMDAKGHPTSDGVLWGVFWATHGPEQSFRFGVSGFIHEVYGPRHPEHLEDRTVSSRHAA